MFPVFELGCALFFQAQISFMHERGALQSVVRTFPPQVMMCHPAQLVIDKRNYSAQRFFVTCMPIRQ